jgi:hypothetical protein
MWRAADAWLKSNSSHLLRASRRAAFHAGSHALGRASTPEEGGLPAPNRRRRPGTHGTLGLHIWAWVCWSQACCPGGGFSLGVVQLKKGQGRRLCLALWQGAHRGQSPRSSANEGNSIALQCVGCMCASHVARYRAAPEAGGGWQWKQESARRVPHKEPEQRQPFERGLGAGGARRAMPGRSPPHSADFSSPRCAQCSAQASQCNTSSPKEGPPAVHCCNSHTAASTEGDAHSSISTLAAAHSRNACRPGQQVCGRPLPLGRSRGLLPSHNSAAAVHGPAVAAVQAAAGARAVPAPPARPRRAGRCLVT